MQEQSEEGEWEYDATRKTEASESEVVEELMRETLFNRFYYDVPFKTDIKLTQMAVRSDGSLRAHFHLKVFSRLRVPMLVGKRGRNLVWMKEDMEAKLTSRFGLKSNVTMTITLAKKNFYESLKFNTNLLDDKAGALD